MNPDAAGRRRACLAAGTVTLSMATFALVAVSTRVAASGESFSVSPTGAIAVLGHGNGHGHGMSQYGARGAAISGHSAAQILAFYYPGTALVTLPASTIRVSLSGAGSFPAVAVQAGLSVSGVSGALPSAGISQYRLVPSGAGFSLQRRTAAGWATARAGLPASADFRTTAGTVRLYRTDTTSTVYRGSVGAIRSGAGLITVNRTALDSYVAGVTPREMPASWAPAAVQAQAIAARTYARNAVVSHTAQAYDICDTTQCQVYGGMTHYDAAGHVLWSDDPAALSGHNNAVLTYRGQVIFAQFSASDGGWTADGGQPYLRAMLDPYDNAASGDPYLNWTRSVAVATIAGHYGLSRVTAIEITGRDGHGQWGGRVTAGFVDGVDAAGRAQRIAATGFGLQAALGLPTNWFTIAKAPPSVPTSVTVQAHDASARLAWAAPANTGSSAVSGYRLDAGTRHITLPASSRAAWMTGLASGTRYAISVRAFSLSGFSPSVIVAVTPVAAPRRVNVLSPARLFDTRTSHRVVTAAAPLIFGVPGHGSIPAGTAAAAVQMAVTIVNPTAPGVLRVYPDGGQAAATAAISYRAGVVSTTTVTVPFEPSARVVFAPSAGSVSIVADQVGYSAASGSAVHPVGPVIIADMPSVSATVNGRQILARVAPAVPASATAVVLVVNGRTSGPAGWLRVWADGAAEPAVSQVSVSAASYGTNTVLVPLGANGNIRIRASSVLLGAQLGIAGYLAAPVSTGGSLESFVAAGVFDSSAGAGRSVPVGPAVSSVATLGVSQLPAPAAAAALVQVTAGAATGAGWLWVYDGPTRPSNVTLRLTSAGSVTSTVLVPLGADGRLSLVTSGPHATVAIDVIGYVTR